MLRRVANTCDTIDYFCIMNCKDCHQISLMSLQLTRITSRVVLPRVNVTESKKSILTRSDINGISILLSGAPLITSLEVFWKLHGTKLLGGIRIANMGSLKTLDGLSEITWIGHNDQEPRKHVQLERNAKLKNVLALSNNVNSSTVIYVAKCPALVCVPNHWPTLDMGSRTIRAAGGCTE
jgi:hypothetical protein